MEWWKERVIYQIYPRSFADSNNDGIGDLKGIRGKLDYLKDLGIGAIWLSPHYPSPFIDCGYDVSDYTAVADEYGNMEDFRDFLDEAHKKDIKVILDLVLNHTSDQHRWFIESASSKDNPKRDWYIWHKNRGSVPNDWKSCFKGSAWTLDEKTDEFYYHFFLKEQPDLNWRNPEVKEVMFNVLRFWLDMGVDGFRIDAITAVYEDESLIDQGMTEEVFEKSIQKASGGDFLQENLWENYMRHQIKQPELHDLIRDIRKLTESYGSDILLVGELSDTEYLGNGTDELHMVFDFPLMYGSFTKDSVLNNQRERLPLHPEGSWQGLTFSNHDQSRIRSKYGNDHPDHPSLKQAVFLLMTLKGTPFLYNGEELGMKNYSPESIDGFKDLKSVNLFHRELNSGKSREQALQIARIDTRDRCRTPMPWNGSENGGFSKSGIKTWLPLDPEYKKGINVQSLLKKDDSILNFYRSIIRFRNDNKGLQLGEYEEIDTPDRDLFAFRRIYGNDVYEIIINFSSEKCFWNRYKESHYHMVFGTTEAFSDGYIGGSETIIMKVIV